MYKRQEHVEGMEDAHDHGAEDHEHGDEADIHMEDAHRFEADGHEMEIEYDEHIWTCLLYTSRCV